MLAVSDVSFKVAAGEVFCIMGLSGSGKSTLVRHVNRLIEPSAGEILIHGDDIGRKSAADLRRLRSEKIGMVFQHVAIFPHRTVRDNVAFGLEIRGVDRERRRAIADEKLALVRLAGWGERYPEELSGGMQQRVGLARALAADPDILLLDEPFSALDPLIRRELQDEFIRLSSAVHKTTVFITHDLDEAIRVGDRIAIMKDGRFVQVGTPEDIVTAPADDYVAAFVRGVSRLTLLKAIAFIDPDEKPLLVDSAWPRVSAETALGELLDQAVSSDAPIVVAEAGGNILGLITRRSLLDGIRGRMPAREDHARHDGETRLDPLREVHLAKSGHDFHAEAAGADERADHDHRQRHHHALVHARPEIRQRERQLDLEQDLHAAAPESAPRFDCLRAHLIEPDGKRASQRRQRKGSRREHARRRAHAEKQHRRNQIDEGRCRLHVIENRRDDGSGNPALGDENPEGSAYGDRKSRRDQDEGNRIHGGTP